MSDAGPGRWPHILAGLAMLAGPLLFRSVPFSLSDAPPLLSSFYFLKCVNALALAYIYNIDNK